jgi:hypothetical protein
LREAVYGSHDIRRKIPDQIIERGQLSLIAKEINHAAYRSEKYIRQLIGSKCQPVSFITLSGFPFSPVNPDIGSSFQLLEVQIIGNRAVVLGPFLNYYPEGYRIDCNRVTGKVHVGNITACGAASDSASLTAGKDRHCYGDQYQCSA